MENYYAYLPTSGSDDRWGLTLLNVGCGEILNSEKYPLHLHPSPYQFQWQQGRLLKEYQLIYISSGSGVFESKNGGIIEVKEGSVILLFPGEWHRYKPRSSKGWVEYWIGFKGRIADDLIINSFFLKKEPLMYTGVRPDIISLYQYIIGHAKTERSGYQPLVGGMVLHLLGLVHSIMKQQALEHACGEHQNLVQRAMVLMRQNTEAKITSEDVADQLQVGYSLFRKLFKKHTGLAPGQYLIQLKIDRAKDYLLFTDKRVKEIAFELNFESEYYFSKFFKEKTGHSPLAFKKNYLLR